MITRHIRSLSVTVLLFAAAGLMLAVSAALGLEAPVNRGAPRLAIVDARKATSARDAQHRMLVASLAAAASVRSGHVVDIAADCVSAGEAKERFLSGRCDAVLIVGDDRPFTLRRLQATTYCGMLEPEVGVRPVYLIVAREPAPVQELLTSAFGRLLGDRAALRAILAAGAGGAVATLAP